MASKVDDTHSPNLKSWVESANISDGDFPIQNLPFCKFRGAGNARAEIGVGIGDQILKLSVCAEHGLFSGETELAARSANLKSIMRLSKSDREHLRKNLSEFLSDEHSALAVADWRESAFVLQADVELVLPCEIGDYTDFYASVFHATNVGSMFRPDNPLLPNYKHIPIGYHGRASSIVASGRSIRRPNGQLPPPDDGGEPTFGPCKNLDYELEVGAYIAQGNRLGQPIGIEEAEAHVFGLSLLNDWSARDMQRWEYQPLGPFLAKSFATTVSPWIVTIEALAPFRCRPFERPKTDPQPLPYLNSEGNQSAGGFDITLEVLLSSSKMRKENIAPIKLSEGTFRNMYWTLAQMVAHHSSNGCNLRAGDLLGSGTISGPEKSSRGCLLELTWDGEFGRPVPGTQRTALELPTGEKRIFLADGDEVSIRGYCKAEGYQRIGFGTCDGKITASIDS